MSRVEIKLVDEHYEVFRNGSFLFSGDTLKEVSKGLEEIEEIEEENNDKYKR